MIKSLCLIGKTSKSCSVSATVCVVLGLALLPAHAQVTGETKARQLLRENRLDEALAAVDIELKERPSEGPLWLLKGAALSMNNRKDDAVQIFKKMIQDKMEVASAYNNLGVIYTERGDFESARLALEAAVRSKPDYAVAMRNLGNVYANLAGMSYKRALQLDGTDQSLAGKLAQLGDMLGKKFDQLVGPQLSGPAEPLPEPSIRTPAPRTDGTSRYASAVAAPAEKVIAPSLPTGKPEQYVGTLAVSYAPPPSRAEAVRLPAAPKQNTASAQAPNISVAAAKPKAGPVAFEWQTGSTPPQPMRIAPPRISPIVVAASAAAAYSPPQQPVRQPSAPDLWAAR